MVRKRYSFLIIGSDFRYAGWEMDWEIALHAIGGEHYGYWNGVQ